MEEVEGECSFLVHARPLPSENRFLFTLGGLRRLASAPGSLAVTFMKLRTGVKTLLDRTGSRPGCQRAERDFCLWPGRPRSQ